MGSSPSTALPSGRAGEIAEHKRRMKEQKKKQEEVALSKLGRATRDGGVFKYTTTTGCEVEFDYGVPNFNGASDLSRCLAVPHGKLYRLVRVNNSCTPTETEAAVRQNQMSAINAARIRGAAGRGEDPAQASRRMDDDDSISNFSDPDAAALARATVTGRARQDGAAAASRRANASGRRVRIDDAPPSEAARPPPGLTACEGQRMDDTDDEAFTLFDEAALKNDAYWVSSTQRDERPLLCAATRSERVGPLSAQEIDGEVVQASSVASSKRQRLQKMLTFTERHTWAFFNDSFDQTFVVKCVFHSNSRLKALSDTVLYQNAEVEASSVTRGTTKMWVAQVAVHPLETKMFVEGKITGGYRLITDVFVQPVRTPTPASAALPAPVVAVRPPAPLAPTPPPAAAAASSPTPTPAPAVTARALPTAAVPAPTTAREQPTPAPAATARELPSAVPPAVTARAVPEPVPEPVPPAETGRELPPAVTARAVPEPLPSLPPPTYAAAVALSSPAPAPAVPAAPAAPAAPVFSPTPPARRPSSPALPPTRAVARHKVLPADRREQPSPHTPDVPDADDGADVPAAVTRRRVLHPPPSERPKDGTALPSIHPHLNRAVLDRDPDEDLRTPLEQAHTMAFGGPGKPLDAERSLSQGTVRGGLSVSGTSQSQPSEEGAVDRAAARPLPGDCSPMRPQQPSGSSSTRQSALFCIIPNQTSAESLALPSDQNSQSVVAE